MKSRQKEIHFAFHPFPLPIRSKPYMLAHLSNRFPTDPIEFTLQHPSFFPCLKPLNTTSFLRQDSNYSSACILWVGNH